MVASLAVKYRPHTFDDVTEQSAIRTILEQQIQSGQIKNCYLFCGPAGTGKTTCARIFAKEINNGLGTPVEMDAASNNGVDYVRELIAQAKIKSLDSEYKVFILDECHALSNSAWQAMLKIIEEPPAKSIFIFCTTDPQKIPKTILSRVQRYDFQRISYQGVVSRLLWVLDSEGYNDIDKVVDPEPIEYIAKLADGGMRDALTMLDKCLAYSSELTLQKVVDALGAVEYDTMFDLTCKFVMKDKLGVVEIIDGLYSDGKNLQQFIKQYTSFMLDVIKWCIGSDWKLLKIPKLPQYEEQVEMFGHSYFNECVKLLNALVRISSEIKYSSTVKEDIESELLLEILYE